MTTYYDIYQNKEVPELIELLDNCSALTLDARMALQQLIKDKHINVFPELQVQPLEESINNDLNDIKYLKYLNGLNIDLFEFGEHNIIIKKSNSANSRNLWGVLLGSFMLIFLLISILLWVNIFKTGIEMSKIYSAIFFSTIGVFGALLLIKALDRIIFYSGFMIQKNNDRIILKYRPNMQLEEFEFSSGSQLKIKYIDDNAVLYVAYDNESKHILNFNDLTFQSMESLNSMIDRFNN